MSKSKPTQLKRSRRKEEAKRNHHEQAFIEFIKQESDQMDNPLFDNLVDTVLTAVLRLSEDREVKERMDAERKKIHLRKVSSEALKTPPK